MLEVLRKLLILLVWLGMAGTLWGVIIYLSMKLGRLL